jgi:formamidopyrimidine-DNA glycosylase
MPELPEVETIRIDLDKTLPGKKILGLWTDSPKQFQPSLKILEQNLVGSKVKQIKRRAKLILFYLSNGKILVVHLKLTGRLLLRKADLPKDDWQHAIFKLSDDLELRFCDLRKFGYLKLIESEADLKKLLSEFGPEPLTKEFTLEKFKEILSGWGRPIKLLLMDQQKIAGIGNIYANEALYLARIDPRRPAHKINGSEAKKLFAALGEVLKRGLKYRGASDQYYLDAYGKKGKYQEHFLVYGQAGKKCPQGGEIKRITLGGRGTFFCPTCQK